MNWKPIRLTPWFREMIWGTRSLEPWYPAQQNPVGEVWFSADRNGTDLGVPLGHLRSLGADVLGTRVPPERFPILIKFIFTLDRLSVQVHPDDEYAGRVENGPGKTEMWHVLRAEPGARIALGLREPTSRERLREAALSGEIEALMQWFPARAGDTFFTPPGTVHAIGAGVVICEIQQNSDLTYRLYDYGRPRELHLDKAIEVANPAPHPGPSKVWPLEDGRTRLACCEYFATETWDLDHAMEYRADPERCHFLVVLEGSGDIGGRRFEPGEAWLVPATADPFTLAPEGSARLIRTYVP